MKKTLFLIYDTLVFICSIILKIFDIINIFKKRDIVISRKINKIVILCNGPSLKEHKKKIPKKKKSIDIYAVNYFALTKDFFKIKSNFYFMADAVFWRDDANKLVKNDNSKLYKMLLKVNWPMTLYCPENGFKILSNKLKVNKNIFVIGVKPRSLVFKSEKLNIFSFINGLSKPVFNNVLILALWHAVRRKVDKIEVYGADFSSFRDYSVDQTSNFLYSSPKHFYKNSKAQSKSHYKYKNQKQKKLHTRLHGVSISFYNIYLLSKVAEKLGIMLLNYSKMSYIDSIKRPKY